MKVKHILILITIFPILLSGTISASAQNKITSYLSYQKRNLSPGNTTYYVNPQSGNDNNTGIQKNKPWKSFRPVNQLVLLPGDRLDILSSGVFLESLVIMAKGKQKSPVKIRFAPGTYNFFPDQAYKEPLHISNTNDSPLKPKSIALMFDNCQFTYLEGANAKLIMRGKMMEVYMNNCTDVIIDGLSFDYKRPTVSELKVTGTGQNYSDIEVHKDSKFSIKDSLLTWVGEGWSSSPQLLWQILNIKNDHLNRIDIPMKDIRFALLGGNKLRAYYPISMKSPRFEKGFIYQNRNIERDYAGIFLQRSRNTTLKNMRINFMHGMGMVVQYCENIKIANLVVKPADSSGRKCAAWADILHFSGCKGKIEIADSYLSAANDDAINVHGVYLKISKIEGAHQVRMRFMHEQTFGFNPYAIGDSIDFIRPESLIPIQSNVVLKSTLVNDKEVVLTLKNPIPTNLSTFDVVENTTATPEVWIHHNTITRIPTRGILITTRRKAVIERNDFFNTHMHAILVDNDALYWFESGLVRDLTIKENNFYDCGEPVIAILPENIEFNKIAVHSNISIINNDFELKDSKLLSAKSTSNLKIINNKINMWKSGVGIEKLIELKESTPVQISGNKILLRNHP